MQQLTTYRAKGKEVGITFLFKYTLNGDLKAFEVVQGELTNAQQKWLFGQTNFPADEKTMRSNWYRNKDLNKIFDIEVSPADISFTALWNLYDHKVKRVDAEKRFNKLNEADKIKCFTAIPGYNQYLERKQIAKAHLSTFINQRYFEDEWHKA